MKRPLAAGLVALLLLLVLNATGETRDTHHADRFWRAVQLRADEWEQFTDWKIMAAEADAVVLGAVTDISVSRTFNAPNLSLPVPEASQIVMARLHVRVDRVMAGSLADDWRFEVQVNDRESLEALSDLLAPDQSMFFLRHKAISLRWLEAPEWVVAENHGYYRLVTQTGVLVDVDGKATAQWSHDPGPLAEFEGVPFSTALETVSSHLLMTRPSD